mmetsp:Transcript_29052/g.25693  ORF Transcript_29052/g.25693 Transcript_29052/m.25693 type:complete len:118 (-) Transcript_29052:85-438(-)
MDGVNNAQSKVISDEPETPHVPQVSTHIDNLVRKVFMDIKIHSKINQHCIYHNIKSSNLSDSFEKFIDAFTKTNASLLRMNQTSGEKLEKYWKQEYEAKENGGNRAGADKRRNTDFD